MLAENGRDIVLDVTLEKEMRVREKWP